MSAANYATAVSNLTSFISSLPSSSVKFLFFLASDLTRPKVRDSLRSVDVRGHRFYLCSGSTDNFCYAYSRGFVQYVVTPVATVDVSNALGPSSPRAYNVTINSSGPAPLPTVLRPPQMLAEHGKHLDVGVIQTRRDGLVIKSHLTNYTDIERGGGAFDRSVTECNFKLGAATTLLGADDAFAGCICAPVHTTVGDVYDVPHANMLRLLCSKIAGLAFTGGGWKRVSTKGTRKNMRGGVGPSVFLSDGFVDFLSQRLLTPVATVRRDMETARLFYDETDEIADGSSGNIVVWYDFEDYAASMFQIDAATAFGAYGASFASISTRTAEQWRCLERFASLEQALLRDVAVV